MTGKLALPDLWFEHLPLNSNLVLELNQGLAQGIYQIVAEFKIRGLFMKKANDRTLDVNLKVLESWRKPDRPNQL